MYIGPDCLIDLTGKITIGKRATISPRCVFMTHADPGSFNGNKLNKIYPRKVQSVSIGEDTWIGVGSTVLGGTIISDGVVIGACTLVNKNVDVDIMIYDRKDKVIRSYR